MKRPRIASVFRWGYVAPRALVALTVVLAVRYGLDPALHWTLVTAGQAALGAKVEVGEVATSLRGGEMVLSQFAAANPHKPMRNLLEAEHIHLAVDPGQLLRKRVVVRNGLVRNLQFDGIRATSGALELAVDDPAAGPSMFDPALAAAGEQASLWFGDLQGRLEVDLEAQLQTPRVLKELESRWPQQYAALKARADALRGKIRQFETEFQEAKNNPLRGLQQIDTLRPQLAATEAELRAVLKEINSLPAQAQADRAAVDAARKADQQFLQQQLKLSNVDGQQLTQYLLGETAHGYLSQAAYWIEQVRHYMPQKGIAKPPRARGVIVSFLARRQPQMLIERVQLTASARMGNQLLRLEGELTDVASQPEWHARPLRLCLASTGAVAADMTVELDRRGDVAHDSLVLDCPSVMLPSRDLGKPGSLAVKVASGEASIKANLRLDDDRLTGTIRLRQSSTLEAVAPAIRDDRIVQVLHESLAGVDRLEATIQLAGTLKRPDLRIESNVGPQLAAGVNGAASKYLADRRDRLVAKVQGQVDEQLGKLEAVRQQAQQQLLANLGEDQQLVTQLASLASGKASLNDVVVPKLGKSLQDKLR